MPTSNLSPQQFVTKWRASELKERSASQEHFLDLCALLGQPTPAEADPSGAWYTFEAGAAKLGGGEGYADAWKRGYFAWEYKGKHADLARAYEQLLKYRESLENPPLLVVADMERIVIHTNFTNSVKRVVELGLQDLLDPAKLSLLRAVFENPEGLRPSQRTDEVTEEAAKRFARLAELLRRYGEAPERAAHFLIRLLFCLFAEDADLLPAGLFSRLVQQARLNPGSFKNLVQQLFGAMAAGGWFGADRIRAFDGTLFDDAAALELDSEGLEILAGVDALDWSAIEPSILGTLFERSLDPSKRAQLGAHYTSRADIELIVEPVLMAPLGRRWEGVQARARELAAQRDAIRGAKRAKLEAHIKSALEGYAVELASVQVLDPACGSGNFLYVALRRLLDQWKKVSLLASDLGLPQLMPLEGQAPSPAQLHGIEINPYAHELAQTTVWIGYIQWLRENGYGAPQEPILKPLHTILLQDAILAGDEAGHPVEPPWPPADVIIGNPPFLGSRKMRPTLGEAYCAGLEEAYRGRIEGTPDLICYWFERARRELEQNRSLRVGLLATQGIRGSANRRVLERIAATGRIFWAYADRGWILDGANVHVSMIGFDGGAEQEITLDGRKVVSINSDLTSVVDTTLARVLPENQGIAFQGIVPRGPFVLSHQEAFEMLQAIGNPNGRPNSDVIKLWRNGEDLTGRCREAYVIDFGLDASEKWAAAYAQPFEYARKHVYPARQSANQKAAREKWWLHWNPRPAMRKALGCYHRYIATCAVAKHRLFAWIDSEVLPDHALIVFARDDDYFFGMLHARPHELWARRMGTQLREAESGCRYTPTSTFETYPFPWPPGQEPADDARLGAIAAAAHELVELRERWLRPADAPPAELARRTLTNLYNARPQWLALAHQRLDEAVLDAYGWPTALSDEELLERLLALNLARAGVETLQAG